MRCGIVKYLSEFYKCKDCFHGRGHICYDCKKRINCDYAREYSKTISGLITKIYSRQRKSSASRGHPMPSYSRDELLDFAYKSVEFLKCYNRWVDSGFEYWEIPTFDRIDDYKPYTIDNIRVCTWRENFDRAKRDERNGINKKRLRGVVRTTKDGEFIKEYYSTMQAQRETGVENSSIIKCCKGQLKTSGKTKWIYKENYEG